MENVLRMLHYQARPMQRPDNDNIYKLASDDIYKSLGPLDVLGHRLTILKTALYTSSRLFAITLART